MNEPSGHIPDHPSEPNSAARPLMRRPWFLPGLLVVLLLAAFLLPSQLGISRYQRSIATVMARSIGRPVHLSGVDWRLLPTPAFVLHDLTVSEDASFGAEPLLTARTVIASVNLFSLWRGRPVFSSIHVDQASLNLVRNPAGRWNLEALLAGPAQQHLAGAGAVAHPHTLPYLEATESRINLKFGSEKSPYSLVNSDLSFWQDKPGQWRIRLRGQPVRTDIAQSSDSGQDAGEIRMEGSMLSAASLRQMPVHLQLAWRNAQLGQLSLLLLGDDAGWRGNLTADVALNGTAERATVQGRLRATQVHRAELGPVAPLDFDSNCGLMYEHTLRAIHQLHCDTSIGGGHLLYAAEIPAAEEHAAHQQTVTFQQIPLQAPLDLLRTLRSGIAPGISAAGTLNGALSLQSQVPQPIHPLHRRPHPKAATVASPVWTGALSLTGGELRGGSLTHPWSLPHLTLQSDGTGSLETAVPLPVCHSKAVPTDCMAAVNLSRSGYVMRVTGDADVPALHDFATALGISLPALDGFQDGTADLHLLGEGSWIHSSTQLPTLSGSAAAADALTGTVHLRAARWSHPSLALPISLPDATLTLHPDSFQLQGTVTAGGNRAQLIFVQSAPATAPPDLPALDATQTTQADAAPVPTLSLTLDRLDATAMEDLLAPAEHATGLLAALASRVHPESLPALPALQLTLSANSCTLDRLTLTHCTASLHRAPADPQRTFALDSFRASFAGGSVSATGTIDGAADTQRFRLHVEAQNLQPAPVAALVSAHWSGGSLSATADLATQGTTPAQWVSAATGNVHFDWKHGLLNGVAPAATGAAPSPQKQAHAQPFDRWTGTAQWSGSHLTLGANTLTQHGKTIPLTGTIPYGGPPQLILPHFLLP